MKESVVVYPSPGADPAEARMIFQHGDRRVLLVAIPDEQKAADPVAELVDRGASLVELCGGFGPVLAAPVIARVGGRVPVGAIGYGVESLELISRFHLRFEAGERQSEAFAILVPGIDPAANRVVTDHGGGRKFTVQAVPDLAAAERFAIEQADRGAGLLELFGDFGIRAAARVYEAAGGRIPVGTSVFGIESLDAAAVFHAS